MRYRISAILLLICSLSSASAVAASKPGTATGCMPYIGEHMSFSIGWEFITAGSASMDITGNAQAWQARTFARTNKVLDIFKKVRDYITATGICVGSQMQSTLFDANLKERKYTAQKRTEFLWKENRVAYTQHHVSEYFDVPAGHLSVIDAFLAVRKAPLKAGDKLLIPIFDSRKRYELEVNIKPETVILKAPWGEKVRCIIVTPKLKTAGIFTNKGEMTLWMTDDARHIPIKMMAKIKFGRIFARLTGYSPPSASPAPIQATQP